MSETKYRDLAVGETIERGDEFSVGDGWLPYPSKRYNTRLSNNVKARRPIIPRLLSNMPGEMDLLKAYCTMLYKDRYILIVGYNHYSPDDVKQVSELQKMFNLPERTEPTINEIVFLFYEVSEHFLNFSGIAEYLHDNKWGIGSMCYFWRKNCLVIGRE